LYRKSKSAALQRFFLPEESVAGEKSKAVEWQSSA
jgi:hypothetical protein